MRWMPLFLAILLIILVVFGSRIDTNDNINSDSKSPSDPKIESVIKVITPKN